MGRLCRIGMFVLGFGLIAIPLSAQTTNLVDLMSNLFVQNVVLSRTPGGGGVAAHTPVFLNDPKVTDVTALINQVSQQIGAQVSNFPIGSSSSGFTYTYDASLGAFTRTTDTFGPAFAERAVPTGKGKFSFGMNYLHTSYNSLDGQDLEDGSIKFNLLHQALSPPSFVEGDVIQAALSMKLSSDTTAFLFNYGVTDKLDVGLAVPIVHVSMDLTYHATILDFATHTVSPTTHVFADGSKTQDSTTSASASGIGDIVILGKYTFYRQGNTGVAAAVDITVPSGDADNMLGLGATQTRLSLIVSGGTKVSPHFNFGYTMSGGGSGTTDISNQVTYIGGLEYALSPRATIVGDFLGRTMTSTTRFDTASTSHTFQQGATAPVETTTLQSIAARSGSLTSSLGTIGVKVNPTGRLLISAHLLIPMSDGGLRAGVTPVIGFDYSF